MTIRYFSMFSGIGGFEYGLQKSKHNFECVGFCEIDKYAVSIYEKHYPNHTNWGDATRIRTEELPDFDFLVGGFPCQSFSIAGNRRGLNDARGTLFFEIARILKNKRPRYFLLENVRNLLSHDNGQTFQTILKVLSDLDYYVETEVYNSKDYGVPQRRERVFIKGYSIERTSSGKVLPFRKDRKEVMGGAVNTNTCKQLNNHFKTYQDGRIYSDTGLSICINARGNNGWYQLSDDEYCTVTKDGDMFALTTRHRGRPFSKHQDNYIVNTTTKRIRKPTPIECERLQGFKDNWTQYGKNGEEISDTQRYKTIGNAVTTNVITAIVDEMFDGVQTNGV